MTEKSRREGADGPETVRREVIQAYRARYARTFRRRWGVDAPGRRVKRVAFVHGGPQDGETGRRRAQLEARGAAVGEWWPASVHPPAIEEEWHAMLLLIGEPEEEGARRRLSRSLVLGVGRGALVAAAPPAVPFLAREGLLRGRRAACPPADEEEIVRHGASPAGSPLARDGVFLTCSAWERVPELIRSLLDLLHPARQEGASER
ncbi:MAG: hypothetical protein ABIH26_05685 [Candidatus Eisenbacteria bacterium]